MAEKDGDYRLCFDNTFSHMSPKTVFFEIYGDIDDDGVDSDDWSIDNIEIGEMVELTVEELKVGIIFSSLLIRVTCCSVICSCSVE